MQSNRAVCSATPLNGPSSRPDRPMGCALHLLKRFQLAQHRYTARLTDDYADCFWPSFE